MSSSSSEQYLGKRQQPADDKKGVSDKGAGKALKKIQGGAIAAARDGSDSSDHEDDNYDEAEFMKMVQKKIAAGELPDDGEEEEGEFEEGDEEEGEFEEGDEEEYISGEEEEGVAGDDKDDGEEEEFDVAGEESD
jgi:hypothetical protein